MTGIDKDIFIKYVFAKLAEAPALARSYTETEGKKLKYRTVYIKLEKYVNDFLAGNIENRLIVLPGLRGVGKTTVIFQIYEYLLSQKKIEQDRILYFSTDELRAYLDGRIADVINIFIQEIHRTSLVNLDREVFILIDEAHFDKEWAQAAKIVFDQSKKAFLIVTGSSALNLELSVDVARRAKREVMFPMNFSEYLLLKHDFYPPRGMAESMRGLIFSPTKNLNLAHGTSTTNELMRKLITVDRPVEKEWEDFLCFGGFPFALRMNQIDTHERISSVVGRVIEKDIFALQSFSTETRNTISRIITFLALQKPGGTSDAKLAARLSRSPTMIRNILDVLEKTQLVFSVKPYGGAGKVVKKPWKYYFLSPSINAAIRFKLGVYDIRDREMLGILAENLIASYFFRMKETFNMPTGFFYAPEKEGVDFLLQTGTGEIIPVEVGIGKKDEGQIKKAITRYHSEYGVLISDTEEISMKKGIVRIPITNFAFV